MKKVLCVIDMQNDFITGALRNEEGIKIIPTVKAMVEQAMKDNTTILFTRDTHGTDYLNTQEGQKLPVPHCIIGTEGHEIIPELKNYTTPFPVINKSTFGTTELARFIRVVHQKIEPISEIQLVGVCTDICVISNAILLKEAFPEIPIVIYEDACAGVTPQSHEAALQTARSCQIEVKRWKPVVIESQGEHLIL